MPKMLRALLALVVLTVAFTCTTSARSETPPEAEPFAATRQQTYYIYLYYRGSYKTTVYGTYSACLQYFNFYKKQGYTPYGPYLYN